jgi:hypothetical protein
MKDDIFSMLLLCSYGVVALSPFIYPSLKKLIRKAHNRLTTNCTYVIEIYPTDRINESLHFKVIMSYLNNKYYKSTASHYYNYQNDNQTVELSCTETYMNVQFNIKSTHHRILIKLISNKHTNIELTTIYNNWMLERIKQYEINNSDAILISQLSFNTYAFAEKYIYKVAPHFKNRIILVDKTHVTDPLLYKNEDYGAIIYSPFYSKGPRYIETYNGIDIFIIFSPEISELVYVNNNKDIDAKKVICERIFELMSEKTSCSVYNVNNLNEQKMYKKVSDLEATVLVFLQEELKETHKLILMRENSLASKIKSIKKNNLVVNIPINGFGILLHGAPGNGKTTYVKHLAVNTNRDIYSLNLSCIESHYQLFEIAEKITDNKTILLIEDIDRIWSSKIINTDDKYNSEESKNKIGLDVLLMFIDMVISKGIIIIVTCNNLVMDDAFMRKGRFDFLMEFKNCDKYQLDQMLNYFNGCKEEISLDKSVASVYAELLNEFISDNTLITSKLALLNK